MRAQTGYERALLLFWPTLAVKSARRQVWEAGRVQTLEGGTTMGPYKFRVYYRGAMGIHRTQFLGRRVRWFLPRITEPR